MSSLTGGQIVVRTLRDLGAQRIFSVSGNQILPIYDAAGSGDLQIFHMRHESAAAYAAAASAEIEYRPVLCQVLARRQALLGRTCDLAGQELSFARPPLLCPGEFAIRRRIGLVGHYHTKRK